MTPPRKSLRAQTMSGFIWNSAGAVAKSALNLLILIPLARLLSPEDFGIVAAGLVVIRFASLFSELGLGAAVVQRPELEPRHRSAAFTGSLLLGLLFGAVLWLGAPLAADFLHMPKAQSTLRWLALLFPLKGLGMLSEALLKRDLRFQWLASRDVITFGLSYGAIGIPLAFFGAGVWALVAADLSQAAMMTVLRLWVHPPPRIGLERQALRDLLYFGGGHTLAKIGNFLAQQGDNVVVGRMLGAEALGLYSRSYQLMATPGSMLGGVMDRVLFPVMAKVQDDTQRLARAYLRGVAMIALIMLPASAALCALAPEIVAVLLGPKWDAVVLPFQVFAGGMLFRTSYRMSDSIARSTGFVYRRAWRQWIYAGIVLLGAVVAQRWGINGVAVAVLGAITANFLLMAHLSLGACAMTWGRFWHAHLPGVAFAAIAGPVAWASASLLRQAGANPLLTLIVAGGLGGIATLGALWLAPRVLLGQLYPVVMDAAGMLLPLKRFKRTPPDATPAPSREAAS